jgi:hypothetical protein
VTDSFEERTVRISDYEKKCRDALRYESVTKQLSLKDRAFDRLCALLDFIGDSQQALLSVLVSERRKTLDSYFLAYGLLQLLYSRQYSLRDVLKTLTLQIPASLGSSTLVVARDSVIGHPVNNDGAAHVIVRGTLTGDGFEYWSYYVNEIKRGNLVGYEEIITTHLSAMEDGLKCLYEHIAEFENARRRQMRNEPLSSALHGTNYLMQQIGAALVEDRYGKLFSTNSAMLISALSRFRIGLTKRYGEERTAYDIDHVIEGINMLRSIYPPRTAQNENQYRIISDGVESNLKQLETMAHDIDEQEKTALA